MTLGSNANISAREHAAREIDRIGHMLVTRWDRSLATHLLSLVSNLERYIQGEDAAQLLPECLALRELLQLWLLQNDTVPGETERYGALRHHLGIVSQLAMMEGRQLLPEHFSGGLIQQGPHLVYLWMPPSEEARNLSEQLSCYGFMVQSMYQASKLAQALQDATPAAVVAYTDFNPGDPIMALADTIRGLCPLLFCSSRYDFEARLLAVRAGASGFLAWPLLAHELIDNLSFGDLGEKRDPLRVMIVEDMASLAGLYANVLNSHGVDALQVTDPARVLDGIVQFRPDLILMDMYMPECNGMELAQIIRQQRLLDGIPILFLSVEKRQSIQLDTLTLGIDGFLTKPVAPEELVVTVINRARRYRKLRSYMINDSLTGLLNHSHLYAQLEYEVLRAKRDQRALSLVMLDLDHFKTINDTYGHPAGDEVLVNLARFLKERLRRSDLISRYGGEEFAIVLPGTRQEDALRIMNAMRQAFSQIEQRSNQQTFRQTFSVGISSLATADDTTLLVQQADDMLYQAKRLGRNRVEGYSPEHVPLSRREAEA
ncbi:GGDEF domain-containing protein [Aquitalea aquatilis]|uniref:GGDEF domain-containing protein n=1 Tax=Aquitalea aquatilis TaxID=1537400 RepID=UPI001FE403BE|nr:diguanylate cyclase [Aquitalea aquatilis]